MHNFYANVWIETRKVALKKKTLYLMALTLLLPIGAGLLLANVQNSLGIGAIHAEEFPVFMLNLFTGLLLPLFVCMGAADQFSEEIGRRTMKLVLARPISRFKVFASKQATLGIYIAAYSMTALVASGISAIFLSGDVSVAVILDWLIAYGTALLPLITLSIMAVLLAQFFSSGSGALITSILLFAAAKIGAVFFPQISAYSPVSYLDWHMIWLGSPAATDQLWSVFMFLLGCSILFFTAGFYLFNKKEL
jgi:ABC-2 type transport system permease protein